MPDASLQAGAAATAAAADSAAGAHRRQGAAGQVHQHHAGHRHRHPGVRVHGGQVRCPAATQPPPRGAHVRHCGATGAAVEELGARAVRCGAGSSAALTPGIRETGEEAGGLEVNPEDARGTHSLKTKPLPSSSKVSPALPQTHEKPLPTMHLDADRCWQTRS